VEFGAEIGEYSGVVCRGGLLPSGALKRITYNGPGLRASPSASSAGGS
jgi:hypothetical protein